MPARKIAAALTLTLLASLLPLLPASLPFIQAAGATPPPGTFYAHHIGDGAYGLPHGTVTENGLVYYEHHSILNGSLMAAGPDRGTAPAELLGGTREAPASRTVGVKFLVGFSTAKWTGSALLGDGTFQEGTH